jgi:hypothetical protein
MACSCIKNNYNFFLSDISCEYILYNDLSLWMEGDNYTTPSSYKVNIGTDGNLKEYEVATKGVTELKLKDGVYMFQVTSCQNTYTRWRAVTAKLQCCLDTYLVSEDRPDMEKVKEAQRLLDGAKLYAVYNKPAQANEYYKIAKKLIESLNCDCK